LALSSVILTNNVPMIEKRLKPAVMGGNKIGPIPPKRHQYYLLSLITHGSLIPSLLDCGYIHPNKIGSIPATSPTLSPTLSAIVAGFLGHLQVFLLRLYLLSQHLHQAALV
jgi:hypothetical protein